MESDTVRRRCQFVLLLMVAAFPLATGCRRSAQADHAAAVVRPGGPRDGASGAAAILRPGGPGDGASGAAAILRPGGPRDGASGAAAIGRPGGPGDAPPLLLTGELALVSSSVLRVPETSEWMLKIRWMLEDGTTVARGQRLIELDSTPFLSALEEKEMQAVESEADLVRTNAESEARLAERELDVARRRAEVDKARIDAVLPEELRSRREHQEKQLVLARSLTALAKAEEDLVASRRSAEADAGLKRIALERVRREMAAARTAIERLTIVAPRDGLFLVADHQRERRKLQAGDTVPAGGPLARIPDLSAFKVEALLYDVDDGRLGVGTRLRVLFDAFPDKEAAGTVTDISPVAQPITNDSLRRAFRVTASLDASDASFMRPGFSVKLEPLQPAQSSGLAARGTTPPAPWRAASAEESPHAENRLPSGPFETVSVSREDLVVGVEITGTIQAGDSSQITPPFLANVWDFRIAWMAPEGRTVKKGQPVLRFDAGELGEKLAVAKAEAGGARTRLERLLVDTSLRDVEQALKQAEAEAQRQKNQLKVALPEELTKAADLRKARLDLAISEAEVEQLRRRLEASRRAMDAERQILRTQRDKAEQRVTDLERALAALSVPAPRDGTVIYLSNWRDEKRKVGDQAWRFDRILEVPDLATLHVKGEADEADVARLLVGAPVRFRLDAHSDVEFGGKVSAISPTVLRPTGRAPVKVVRLEASLDKIDPVRMRPGMRVRGMVERERVPGALVLPRDCVFPSAEGPVVLVGSSKSPRRAPVTLGRRSGADVEITRGLSEGDVVFRPKAEVSATSRPERKG